MGILNKNYTHLIVLDFEATCCNTNPPKPQEIIEFPSVLLCLKTFKIVDEFQAFVKPIHNPQLTDFCTNFTSIQQKDIDSAKVFSEVLKDHWTWLQSHQLDESNSLLVTCGDWDLLTMFPAQCTVSEPVVEDLMPVYTQWMNVKKPYCSVLKTKKASGMTGMLRQLGLKLKGHHHRGIDDCRNIAEIIKVLLRKGAKPKVTGTLPREKYPPLSLTLCLGEREESAVLKIRNISSLYGLASKIFKCSISSFNLECGKSVEIDEDIMGLKSGSIIKLSN